MNFPTDYRRHFLWLPVRLYREHKSYVTREKVTVWLEWAETRDPGPGFDYWEVRLKDGEWRKQAYLDW